VLSSYLLVAVAVIVELVVIALFVIHKVRSKDVGEHTDEHEELIDKTARYTIM
jgi:membrane protein YdbS with pleckstrin-like domain